MFHNEIGACVTVRRLIILLATILLLAACGGNGESGDRGTHATAEPVASDGDTVAVHYHGTLDSGAVFDSSRERDPFTFVVGSGQVISGFDEAVRGLAVGETIKVRLEPSQAYGERRNDLIFEVARGQAPDGLSPGDSVRLDNGASAVVLEVTDDVVRIDANHPLAGQALTFEIELVSIH